MKSRLAFTTLLSTLLLVGFFDGTALSADISLYDIPDERSEIYLHGTFQEVEATLFENGDDLNGFSSRGVPPLIDICDNPTLKDSEVAQIIKNLVITRGVDVNTPHRTVGVAALHVASGCRNPQVVGLLLESNADIHQRDNDGAIPLMYASYHRNTDTERLLVESKSDIHARNKYGLSAADYAEVVARDTRGRVYLTRDFQAVSTTLSANADDMNDFNSWGSTTLIDICANYSLEDSEVRQLVQDIVTRGIDINTPHRTAGVVALHIAADRGRSQTVGLLLESKADITQRDKWGLTPLMYASSAKGKGNAATIKLLIESKANIDDTNAAGQSAAHYAAVGGATYNLGILIKSGANTQLLTLSGKSVFSLLHESYTQGRISDRGFMNAKNLLANPERELEEEEEEEEEDKGTRKSVMRQICAVLCWK